MEDPKMINEYPKNGGLHDLLAASQSLEESNPAYYFGGGTAELGEWLEAIRSADCLFYAKRLSGNETGATESHQSGIYLPLNILKLLFPEVHHINTKDPDHFFNAVIDSHDCPEITLRAVYYNGKPRAENSRNEARITRWKMKTKYSPIQDPENTGALVLFAFFKNESTKNSQFLKTWVCRSPEEESYAELIIGEVLPGDGLIGPPSSIFGGGLLAAQKKVSIQIPDAWKNSFPSGLEIVSYIIDRYKFEQEQCDDRLIKRRDLEFGVFRTIEEFHSKPLITNGFDSIDDFITVANSIANRRKSRSGRSLEIHLENIFREEELVRFSSQCVTENKKKPDFIFPSCAAYHNPLCPAEKLRMLAVKTTCKDRWRQLLNEANRISNPFLFTLQEGVSINQYAEMKHAGVTLVVPAPLHKSYPKQIRGDLLTLDAFIRETKILVTE